MSKPILEMVMAAFYLFFLRLFILRFYSVTMSSVVRPDSGLSVGLAELTQLSRTQFLSMLGSSVSHWSATSAYH